MADFFGIGCLMVGLSFVYPSYILRVGMGLVLLSFECRFDGGFDLVDCFVEVVVVEVGCVDWVVDGHSDSAGCDVPTSFR